MSSIHYITKNTKGDFQIEDLNGNVIAQGDSLALTPCMDEFFDEIENYESYQSVHESDLLYLQLNKIPVYVQKKLGKPIFLGGKIIIIWTT